MKDLVNSFVDWKIAEAETKLHRHLNYTQASKIWSDLCENVQNSDKIINFLAKLRIDLGEKKQYQIGIKWLAKNYPEYIFQNFQKILEIGYWKDLLNIWETCCDELLRSWIIYIFGKQLKQDYTRLLRNTPYFISICAKWAPTEGCALDKKTGIVRILCEQLGWTFREYRQRVSKMRNELGITERLLCDKRWGELEFEKIPHKALQKYHNTLLKHCGHRYSKWTTEEKNRKLLESINTMMSGIDIMYMLRTKKVNANFQWSLFLEKIKNVDFGDCVCVCDTSPLMLQAFNDGIVPIDIVLAMTLISSKQVVNFSDECNIYAINGSTMAEKIETILALKWNFDLNFANCCALLSKREKVPDCVYIFAHKMLEIPTDLPICPCPIFYINLGRWNKYTINLDYYSNNLIIFNGFSIDLFNNFINTGNLLIQN